MDTISSLKQATAEAMHLNGLIWDQRPYWATAPLIEVASNRKSTIQVIAGRLLSTNSGRTEFIGPHTDEARFWEEARHVALDSSWDGEDDEGQEI
jgi:hypothetical protein